MSAEGDSFPSIKNSTWDAGMTRVFGRAGGGDDGCGLGFDFGVDFGFDCGFEFDF